MGEKKRLGVLISGRGSNMAALMAACTMPDYPARIAVVISNRPQAGGLEIAAQAGIKTLVIDHKSFATRADFDAALSRALADHGCDIVCNAGFMRLLTAEFVQQWRGRLLNIHPSLLPAFKGLHIHERVIAAGVRMSGCTVHFVSAEMDAGPIIAQAAVPVLPDDDADRLAARVLVAEHRLYPQALRLVATGRVRLAADAEGEERVIYAPDAFGAEDAGMLCMPPCPQLS